MVPYGVIHRFGQKLESPMGDDDERDPHLQEQLRKAKLASLQDIWNARETKRLALQDQVQSYIGPVNSVANALPSCSSGSPPRERSRTSLNNDVFFRSVVSVEVIKE